MGQQEIMEFLDEHRGKQYSAHDLVIIFEDSMNRNAVYRSMKKIIKREEYSAIIKNVTSEFHHKQGAQVTLYWRK